MLFPSHSLKWVLLSYNSLVWGSSFILIKKALVSLSYEQIASYRIFFSALFSFAIIPFYLKKIKSFDHKLLRKKTFFFLFLVAFLGIFLPSFLFPFAQQKIDSFIAGVTNSISPIWAMMISVFFYRDKIKKGAFFYSILGFLGVILLFSNGGMSFFQKENIFFASFILLATITYSLATNILKHELKNISSLIVTIGVLLSLFPVASGLFLFSNFFSIPFSGTFGEIEQALLYVSILALFSTVLGVFFHTKLVQISNVSFASQSVYFAAIVSVIWGLIDGEELTPFHLLGIIIIFISVYFVTKFTTNTR